MARTARILIVEDEPLISMCLASLVEEQGNAPLEVGTADEAKALMDDGQQVDLIVTDIHMPGTLDGLDLARHASGLIADLPVIVCSGKIRPDADELPKGAVFFEKPYDFDKLGKVIQRQLQR
ncbi:hypothetical protein GCM10007989_37190 [Devosia pacifica]|uniref:Response regulatory domain-containing protein n=1 Tax=Devosia pacifica TaxID=1335967 RepID=A0A918VZ87_9HYPH|nr:response regulator [Devosia pacifica]GHA37864.1 hypothetical protein GCM10007989_37190 [Devosia pacifica]